ncbi:YihY/virulence factor BrkB family protein [Mesorhizobium sp. LSHC414A00]|uniref:YihY/virulence factor BrkB family protein n=1 Tax=Mesorhizobium sp. LSHC414A00 TaxID=1287287 RepID=UPI0026885D99
MMHASFLRRLQHLLRAVVLVGANEPASASMVSERIKMILRKPLSNARPEMGAKAMPAHRSGSSMPATLRGSRCENSCHSPQPEHHMCWCIASERQFDWGAKCIARSQMHGQWCEKLSLGSSTTMLSAMARRSLFMPQHRWRQFCSSWLQLRVSHSVLGFMLLVSLVASAAISALGNLINAQLPFGTLVLGVINAVVSFVLLAAIFAAIFKILPDRTLEWRDVWIGAVVTAALFTLGKSLIGWYIGSSAVAASYGAAGGLLVILLWAYYSAEIFLFGAEITRAYSIRHGSRSDQEAVLHNA